MNCKRPSNDLLRWSGEVSFLTIHRLSIFTLAVWIWSLSWLLSLQTRIVYVLGWNLVWRGCFKVKLIFVNTLCAWIYLISHRFIGEIFLTYMVNIFLCVSCPRIGYYQISQTVSCILTILPILPILISLGFLAHLMYIGPNGCVPTFFFMSIIPVKRCDFWLLVILGCLHSSLFQPFAQVYICLFLARLFVWRIQIRSSPFYRHIVYCVVLEAVRAIMFAKITRLKLGLVKLILTRLLTRGHIVGDFSPQARRNQACSHHVGSAKSRTLHFWCGRWGGVLVHFVVIFFVKPDFIWI